MWAGADAIAMAGVGCGEGTVASSPGMLEPLLKAWSMDVATERALAERFGFCAKLETKVMAVSRPAAVATSSSVAESPGARLPVSSVKAPVEVAVERIT